MSASYRVDLAAFSRNLQRVREAVAPAAHMLVVKDDAYAHGLIPLVVHAYAQGVRWFGAFDVATGEAVRSAVGPEARIFVWLVGGADDLAAGVAADLDLGIGDEALLDDLARLTLDGVARIHLKIDTGLHRNGIRPERWAAALERTAGLVAAGRGVLEGIWSHISEASDADDDAARAVFLAAREAARAAGLDPRFSHLAASAAGFARGEFREDLVRVGAFSYGIRPAGGPGESDLGIEPIAALVATVTAVDVAGVHLDVGSLHGLPSTLAGRFDVGTPAGPRRVEDVGLTTLAVAPWPAASPGDEIVVFGRGALHSATDLAELVDTIGEEIALRVSPTLPRLYVGG
ncbi:alanine racemase [Microbacterium sp. ru370.1]|uniref:alanine racemase n=1 Tax=unclassified Microbacterium TaxID=2609290 RepID=UPI00088C78D8|nr:MULTISPECIES: alanine racemase [unclassified Microbacterium]SDO76417.1 alanine racemase [Microbacterium sp. ru370.1]SIT88562.1 alanine racemase [Microbacterium sp. RU1D]